MTRHRIVVLALLGGCAAEDSSARTPVEPAVFFDWAAEAKLGWVLFNTPLVDPITLAAAECTQQAEFITTTSEGRLGENLGGGCYALEPTYRGQPQTEAACAGVVSVEAESGGTQSLVVCDANVAAPSPLDCNAHAPRTVFEVRSGDDTKLEPEDKVKMLAGSVQTPEAPAVRSPVRLASGFAVWPVHLDVQWVPELEDSTVEVVLRDLDASREVRCYARERDARIDVPDDVAEAFRGGRASIELARYHVTEVEHDGGFRTRLAARTSTSLHVIPN